MSSSERMVDERRIGKNLKGCVSRLLFVSRVNTVSATADISALWQCVTLPFKCLEVINVLYLTCRYKRVKVKN
jgi:hypothetical protein